MAQQADPSRIRDSVGALGVRGGDRPPNPRRSQSAEADRLHDRLKAAAIDGREKSGRARPGAAGARFPGENQTAGNGQANARRHFAKSLRRLGFEIGAAGFRDGNDGRRVERDSQDH